MRHLATVALMLVVASLASYSSAHSGRTDSSGGHNCSQKSINKGLCSGYHYHNGGSSYRDSTLGAAKDAGTGMRKGIGAITGSDTRTYCEVTQEQLGICLNNPACSAAELSRLMEINYAACN